MLNKRNLRKKYWKYVVPSIISQLVFTLYMVVDALMVARGVSAEALAGVNIASPYVSLLWAIAIMFAVGTSTIIARLMGEGATENADKVFSQTCAVIVLLSAVISVLSYFGAGVIGDFLGATDNTREYTVTYIKTIAPYALFFIASYLLEVLMPIDGYPQVATIVVSIGVALNCILDYVFIFIFDWGVWGAAIATAISQVVPTIIYVIRLCRPTANIRFTKFKWNTQLIFQEMWRGLPSGIADFSPGIAVFIFVKFIGKYLGEDGLIAYSTIQYVSFMLIIIAVAVGQGCQPLVSYNNGAGRSDIIKQLLKFEIKDVAIISAAVIAAAIITAPTIVNIFIPEASTQLQEYSVHAFRLFVTFSLIDVYNIVLSQYATALEKPLSGILTYLFRTTIFLIAGIVIMIQILGPEGIWLGMTASELLTFIMAIGLYKKNKGYLK